MVLILETQNTKFFLFFFRSLVKGSYTYLRTFSFVFPPIVPPKDKAFFLWVRYSGFGFFIAFTFDLGCVGRVFLN